MGEKPRLLSITNSGTITADKAISEYVAVSPAQTASLHLTNSGHINGEIDLGVGSGPNYPYARPLYDSEIINTGVINGAIHLSQYSNDLYDGRGGSQTGGIYLGGGKDTIYLGNDGETVYGGTGTAVIYGGTGADTIIGGPGADYISGGGGNDILTGGGGANTFAFNNANGQSVITDFSDAQGDKIDLSGLDMFMSFAALQAAMSQSGSNTVISLGGSNTITLDNVQASSLTTTDFVLRPWTVDGAYTVIAGLTQTFDVSTAAYELIDAPSPVSALTIAGTVVVASSQANAAGVGLTDGGLVSGDTASVHVASGGALTVDVTGTGSGAVGYLSASSSLSPSILNEGQFEVAGVHKAVGASLGGSANFINSGVFAVTGANATGITGYGTMNTGFESSANATIVNNDSFTVTGGWIAIGVELGSGSVTNAGTMSVTAASSTAIDIADQAGGSVTVTNDAGATITAQTAVLDAGADLTLDNYGTINGAIVLTAGDDSVVNTGSLYGAVTLGSGADSFANSGVFTVTGAAAVGITAAAASIVNNDGFTVTGGSSAIGVELGSGSITNSGTMSVSATSGPSIAIDITSQTGAVTVTNNAGATITAQTAVLDAGADLTLDNSGTINGAVVLTAGDDSVVNTGSLYGAVTLGSDGDSFTNSGVFAAIGAAAIGITAARASIINNDGFTVTGGSSAIGVELESGSVTNAGTMSVSATSGPSTAIDITSQIGWSATVTNDAGATITAQTAVLDTGTDLTLDNSGTINGAVVLTAGDDSVVNTGSLYGAVTLGSGADSFTNSGVFTVTGAAPVGVTAAQASIVNNDGFTITGGSSAIGVELGSGSVTNAGTMSVSATSGPSIAIDITNQTGKAVTVTNDVGATITAQTGVLDAGADLTLDNYGTINGAVVLTAGDDSVVNTGSLYGAVTLGSGADSFTNSGVFAVTGNAAIGITAAQASIVNNDGFTVTGGSSATGVELGSGSITNAGTMSVSATSGPTIAIDITSQTGGSITVTNNAGATITAQTAVLDGGATLTLDNYGTINGAVVLTAGYDSVVNSGIWSVAALSSASIGIAGANDTGGSVALTNNDSFTVTGSSSAIGVELGSGSVTNSGAMLVTASSGPSIAIDLANQASGFVTVTNNAAGTITAQTAVLDSGAALWLDNYGAINGAIVLTAGNDSVVNTGSINGAVTLGSGTDTLDSHAGTINGTITLGSGVETVTLGSENDVVMGGAGTHVVDGGGGTNTISYANAASGVTVSLALPGQAQNTGIGTDTLSNFQTLIGSAFNDTLTAANGTSTLTGGGGSDVFRLLSSADNTTITDFSHADGDTIDLSSLTSFHSISDVLTHATQNGADTVIDIGSGSLTLKNVQATSLTSADFDFAPPAELHINISYDSSVANAPAGFITAVQAAVNYFETTFTNNVTINIDVGWGEINGQTVSADDIAESEANHDLGFTYQQIVNALATADAGSPAAAAAVAILSSADPTDGGDFILTSAEAKVLGLSTTTFAVDGYIGLSAGDAFTFDPNNRAVAGEYDAIGAIEHEISEVLGRGVFGNESAGGGTIDTPLDLFRYAAVNTHSEQPGPAYFSLDGDQLLKEFNDPSNGGDAGDWASSAQVDSYDAFGSPGVEEAVSTVDTRVLQVLGYNTAFDLPTATGTPVAPLSITQTGSLAAGQSLSFNGPAALLFSPTSNSVGPSYTNAGTIIDDGAASALDVVGLQLDPGAAATLAAGVAAVFTNAVSGSLIVNALQATGDAAAVFFGATSVVNDGLIEATSAQADAYGVIGADYASASTGVLTVQAANNAVGVDTVGGSVDNAGLIQVQALHAVGVAYASSFDNSGTLVVTASSGSDSTGVYIGASGQSSARLTNESSGVITAQTAVVVASGLSTLAVAITNTGVINGAVELGSGTNVLDSHAGTINGVVELVGGSSTVTLGAENNTVSITGGINVVDGGGGTNTISYANAASGVHVSLMLEGQAQNSGVSTDTLTNFQDLIGSAFGDALSGGSGVDTLTGGGGADSFLFGPGIGTETITDFSAVQGDTIDLSAFHTFYALADVLADAAASGPNTVISVGGGTITLDGVSLGSLQASDFILSSLPSASASASSSAGQTSSQVVSGLFFRDAATGDFGYMTANPSGGETWHSVGPTSTGYSVIGQGDLTGAGLTDIAFRNDTTGDFGYMSANPSGGETWHPIGPTSPGYVAVGSGDFNGDGVTDVAFRNTTTGDWGFMSLNPNGGETWHAVGPASTAYTVIGSADYSGDGHTDLAFRDAAGDWGYMSVTPSGGEIWHAAGSASMAYMAV